MANLSFIQKTVLTSNQSTVTLSNIPQDYDDLVFYYSCRTPDTSGDGFGVNFIRFNGQSTNVYAYQLISSNGSSLGSSASTATSSIHGGIWPGGYATSGAFSNMRVYIADYTSSLDKPVHVYTTCENNSTLGYTFTVTGRYLSSSAITSISVVANFTQMLPNSTFYIYGVTNA